jgi:hypothetical protein
MIILREGENAPYTGVLVTEERMKKFRQINEEKKVAEKLNIELSDLNELKDRKIKLYKDELVSTNKEFTKHKTKSFFYNIGYFALGVLITGFAAKAAIESTR